jgi:hypothetical protein
LVQDVRSDGFAEIRSAEFSVDAYRLNVKGIHSEYVVVDQAVVPRGARTVISVVLPFHVGVAGKPTGVVVEALAASVGTGCRVLATGDDTVGETSGRDFGEVGR